MLFSPVLFSFAMVSVVEHKRGVVDDVGVNAGMGLVKPGGNDSPKAVYAGTEFLSGSLSLKLGQTRPSTETVGLALCPSAFFLLDRGQTRFFSGVLGGMISEQASSLSVVGTFVRYAYSSELFGDPMDRLGS